tara:strand:- start:64 stop:1266 length:1203 start_codon:yes stop_codon:yes gene_type:complete
MAVNKFDNSMFDAGTIGTTANKLLQLDGSTKIPAVDGSLLTGIPSSFTKSASDPTVSTNPSGGVGTLWINTTSGEAYCCTDATAGSNVWINVGAGSGNIQPYHMHTSSNYGYILGAIPSSNVIERFSFSSDGNGVDVGDLPANQYFGAGCSSTTHGYEAGGADGSAHGWQIDIYKVSFATATAAGTTVGDLTQRRGGNAGCSSSSYGYSSAGQLTPPYPGDLSYNIIDKFSFATDGNATDVGDLTISSSSRGGMSDVSYGYVTGGRIAGQPVYNVIERFSFTSDGNASDVGDLLETLERGGTSESATHGYSSGGRVGGTASTDRIQKFAWGSSSNATDVANLINSTTNEASGGCGSASYGYNNGGYMVNIIQKYSFSSDSNATDVGDMLSAKAATANAQY